MFVEHRLRQLGKLVSYFEDLGHFPPEAEALGCPTVLAPSWGFRKVTGDRDQSEAAWLKVHRGKQVSYATLFPASPSAYRTGAESTWSSFSKCIIGLTETQHPALCSHLH